MTSAIVKAEYRLPFNSFANDIFADHVKLILFTYVGFPYRKIQILSCIGVHLSLIDPGRKKMENKKQEPLSEDVQEIIERMPHWIIRYGLTLLLAIMLMILCLTWFIKYPDVINATITITTSPPPIDLISRAEGTLQLFVDENTPVEKGMIVACIQSNVDLTDVLALEKSINDSSFTEKTFLEKRFAHLGVLQPYYNELAAAVTELLLFESNDNIENQIARIQREMVSLNNLIHNLQQQVTLSLEDTKLTREKLDMDSALFSQQVITKLDYNSTRSQYLTQMKAIKNIETTIINNQVQLGQLNNRITELLTEKLERGNLLKLSVNSARQALISQIMDWRKNYLLVSPTAGKLAYLRFLENDAFIDPGTALFSVIPDQGKIYGQAQLPISRSGKVKAGQPVNIRLENYPFEQYGMLKGRVESIAIMPNEDTYMVRVALPEGLRTTYNQSLPLTQHLSGETEIITEDLRLLERFFYQFRKLVKS